MTERFSTLRSIVLIAVLGAILYLCWKIFEPFAMVLAWSGVLAVVFDPLHRRVAARIRNPNLAALVTLVIAILFVIIPLTALTAVVVREAAQMSHSIEARTRELIQDPRTAEWLRRVEDYAKRWVDIDHMLTAEAISKFLGRISQVALHHSIQVVGGAVGLIVDLTFVAFALFFFIRDGRRLVAWMASIPAWPAEHGHALVRRIRETIDASVYGVLIIAILQGALGAAMFLVLGVPSAILWGVLMTLAAILPLVGPSLIWIPAAIYLAATGQVWKAGVLVVWGAVVIGLIDNFLRPKLIGNRAKLHDLVVFFSVLGGLKIFGLLGFVLGPVLASVGLGILETFRNEGAPIAEPPTSS